jgi:hypothetical protein
MAAEQLAVQFVTKNVELTEKTKRIGPIRKECKTLKESIMQSMEQRGENVLVLPSGVKFCLERKAQALPIKQDYVAEKLAEYGIPRAEEIAQRLWDDRPVKDKATLKMDKGSSSGSGSGSGRKRGRKEDS